MAHITTASGGASAYARKAVGFRCLTATARLAGFGEFLESDYRIGF
jgi:hypothetical protein